MEDVSLLDCGARRVLRAQKYDAAWSRLSLEQRYRLTQLVEKVNEKMTLIEDAFASFLFDPKNQVKDGREGQKPRLNSFQHDAKEARENVLRPLRDLQKQEAMELSAFVSDIVNDAFATVPGQPVGDAKTTECSSSEESHTSQPLESCFENLDVYHVVTRDKWTERVSATMERAAKIVSAPDFQVFANQRCFVDAGDAMFLAIKIDNRDGRTTSLNWLYAEHLLVSDGFHAEVASAVKSLTTTRLCRVVHARAKSGARAKEKTGPNGDYGRLTPKPATRYLKDILRCSLVFESHDAFDQGLKLILSRFATCGKPKDRRNQSPTHDVLLNVFYKDLIAEIQLHFNAVLAVKPLAHLPYEILRTDTHNLQTLHLFDFPHNHLEKASRKDVKSRLSL